MVDKDDPFDMTTEYVKFPSGRYMKRVEEYYTCDVNTSQDMGRFGGTVCDLCEKQNGDGGLCCRTPKSAFTLITEEEYLKATESKVFVVRAKRELSFN